MEDFLGYLAASFFGLAILMIVLVFREVLPLLSPEDQTTFVIYGASRTHPSSREAIRNAWNQHVQSFPASKKRFMVFAFLFAGIITFVSYPVWRFFAK